MPDAGPDTVRVASVFEGKNQRLIRTVTTFSYPTSLKFSACDTAFTAFTASYSNNVIATIV